MLTKKTGPNGQLIKFKARRVVQGSNQVYGRDFFDTFSPVIGVDTLRVIIKVTMEHRWTYRTMDFAQAYLNAPLKETIYVENLDGSTSRLNKALYGLKQAGVEWGNMLRDHILMRSGWNQSKYDDCLFFTSDDKRTRIAVIAAYVDDLFISGSWEQEIIMMQDHLLQAFEGKVDEKPESCLGLQLNQYEGGICIHQKGYCREIVNMVFQTPTREVHTPLDPGTDLT